MDAELIADATAAAQRATATIAGVTFVVLHGAAGVLTFALTTVVPTALGLGVALLWLVLARAGWSGRRRFPIASLLVPIGHAGIVLAVLAAAGRGAA